MIGVLITGCVEKSIHISVKNLYLRTFPPTTFNVSSLEHQKYNI